MKKKNFKSEIILNKKFSTEISGYNAQEVDIFFDKVIEDYNTYEEMEHALTEQLQDKDIVISEKDEEIKKLNIELLNIKNQLKQTEKATNVEMLRAINDLKNKMDNK